MTDIERFIRENPDYRDMLKKLVEYQKEHIDQWKEKEEKLDISTPPFFGFEYGDVSIHPAKLGKLLSEGILFKTYSSSNKPTQYRIKDIEKVEEALEEKRKDLEPIEDVEVDLSTFDKLIEVREIDRRVKKVMERASKKPGIHVALIGGPGTGKSLIASCIEESTRSAWISGTDMTKASLRDELIQTRPRFVLLDELDKFSSKEPVQLLSEPMSDQTLTVQTSGKEVERLDMPINVFATGNRMTFPSNIEDRFLPLHLPQYSDEEFRELILTGFPKNERIDKNIAEAVVDEALEEGVKSYRRCRAVARMCDEPEDVKWVFDTFEFDEEKLR